MRWGRGGVLDRDLLAVGRFMDLFIGPHAAEDCRSRHAASEQDVVEGAGRGAGQERETAGQPLGPGPALPRLYRPTATLGARAR